MSETRVVVQGTPNPNAAKFVIEQGRLGDESRSYFGAHEAAEDPLATRLFGIEGVRALLMVDNFITVTKTENVSWDDMVREIVSVIEEELEERGA
jgi:hypothetical protein